MSCRLINPITENFLALYISIVWYRELTPEESFRLVFGKTNMKRECRNISVDLIRAMDRIMTNKNFKSWDKFERRFKINRYMAEEMVKRYRIQLLCETLNKIKQQREGVS